MLTALLLFLLGCYEEIVPSDLTKVAYLHHLAGWDCCMHVYLADGSHVLSLLGWEALSWNGMKYKGSSW